MPLSISSDAHQARRLAEEIDTQGFTCIPQAVSDSDLVDLRKATQKYAQQYQGEYFALHGADALVGSPLAKLWEDENLKRLIGELYLHAADRPPATDTIFPVLRCIQGQQGKRESGCFHYDASLVTVLIPINIPVEGESRGDLMLFPNLRKINSYVVPNVIQKALVQNKFTRMLINWAIEKKWLKPTRLLLNPGSLYIFWGYRSLHANKPCSPGLMRATALLHFGDPHSGSLSTRLILRINQRRAQRRSDKHKAYAPGDKK